MCRLRRNSPTSGHAGDGEKGQISRPAGARNYRMGDPLGAFLGDLKCDRATPFKQLFEMYEAACRAAGAEPATRRAVGLALSKRFEKLKGGDAAYYARPRLSAVDAAA